MARHRNGAARGFGTLLDFDHCAFGFQLGLELRGLVLRHVFLHALRSAVHEILGFLEAETRDFTDDLDDLDLLRAGFLENDLELGLLFDGRCSSGSARAAAAGAAAAMVTLNFSLNASIISDSSKTDMLPIASRISSLLRVVLAMVLSPVKISQDVLGRCSGIRLGDSGSFLLLLERVERAGEVGKERVHHAEHASHRCLHGRTELAEQLLARGHVGQLLDLIHVRVGDRRRFRP